MLRPGGLLAVDWVPARRGRTEALSLVFDGGLLPKKDAARISVPPDELRGCAFCAMADADDRLSPLLARRIAACLAARSAGQAVYLENGALIG